MSGKVPIGFWIYAGLLMVSFSAVLYRLLKYSLKEELYSHVVLIPFICGYLIWLQRGTLPLPKFGNWKAALVPMVGAVAVLAYWFFSTANGQTFSRNDFLTVTVLPFYLLLIAGVLFFFGTGFSRAIAFPLLFGIFIVPFPTWMSNAMEIGSQHASAEVYAWMMNMVGATYYREGLTFALPNLNIMVAQECSGIRSSFVLFLTSLLAGHMFLRAGWKKALLAFFVIPLGFVRNGFRVLVLSLLTAHVSPTIIDSPLHHHGGPLFFLLSLVPFFALLYWLRRTERPGAPRSEMSGPR